MSERRHARGGTAALARTLLVLALVAAGAPLEPRAEELPLFGRATYFALDADGDQPLYHWRVWQSPDARHRRSEWATPEGRLVTSDELWFGEQGFGRYRLDHHEAQRSGEVTRVGERLEFSCTRDGKTNSRSEDFDERFLVGSMLPDYVGSHWSALMREETLKVRMAVADRCRSIGFKIQRERDIRFEGSAAVVIELKPSSFVVRLLVKPIHLTFRPDGKQIYAFRGMTDPLRKVDGKWRNLMGRAAFELIGNPN